MKKCGDVLLSLLLLDVMLNLTFMENVSTTVTNLTSIETIISGISVDVLDTNTGSGMRLLLLLLKESYKMMRLKECTSILAAQKTTTVTVSQILSATTRDTVVTKSSAQWMLLVTYLTLTTITSWPAVLKLPLRIHSDILGVVKKRIVSRWELNGAHLLEIWTAGKMM